MIWFLVLCHKIIQVTKDINKTGCGYLKIHRNKRENCKKALELVGITTEQWDALSSTLFKLMLEKIVKKYITPLYLHYGDLSVYLLDSLLWREGSILESQIGEKHSFRVNVLMIIAIGENTAWANQALSQANGPRICIYNLQYIVVNVF